MQYRTWRTFAACFGVGVATLFASPRASADVMPPGCKFIDFKMVLRADRFDDYCEHRCTAANGDTFEALAKRMYGDAARADEIAAANPALDASRLAIGTKVILPPKRTPPKDAKETLAWTFWGHASLSGCFPLQRVYPDEEFDPVSVYFGLVAVPAERVAEFEQLLDAATRKQPTACGVWADDVLRLAPWAIHGKGVVLDKCVLATCPATESMTTFRITELAAGPNPPGRFVVSEEDCEYRDRAGNVVEAGIEMLFSWRGIPLGLIVLVGVLGLRRIRRSRMAAAVFVVGLAIFAAPTASADVAPMGIKEVEVRLILRADRFDDYCEHRHVIAQGDTFEAIAKNTYGDAARAKEIAAANPTLEATHLPVGTKILLPPKLAPPKDAKETLAWTFWGRSSRWDGRALQRVYPDETLESEPVCNGILAIPTDRLAEFEKLLDAAKAKDPKFGDPWVEELKARLPWLIPANLFVGEPFVKDDSPAAQSVTTYRIAELAVGPNPPRCFVVKRVSVEYRDRKGNVVKAGFDLLFTWRGIPLGLIALIGAFGLQRMRRKCAARC